MPSHEHRGYLPAEVFLSRLSDLMTRRPVVRQMGARMMTPRFKGSPTSSSQFPARTAVIIEPKKLMRLASHNIKCPICGECVRRYGWPETHQHVLRLASADEVGQGLPTGSERARLGRLPEYLPKLNPE
jgi:hypothetical protein